MDNMTDTAKEFHEKKALVVRNVIPKTLCEKFTKHLWTVHEDGLTVSDDHQAPKSYSVYGVKLFEFYAEQMAEKFSTMLGIDLLPTYVYSRIYQPGEELLNHRDREACEISCTANLGRKGEIWPIYYAYEKEDKDTPKEHKILLEPGDMVWYKGCEVWHWRNPYVEAKPGDWTAQMFLHYVDANGSNAHLAHDSRSYFDKYMTRKKTAPKD